MIFHPKYSDRCLTTIMQVGSLGEKLQPKFDTPSMPQNSTIGFRIMLEKLLVKLTIAFANLDNQSKCPSIEYITCSTIGANT